MHATETSQNEKVEASFWIAHHYWDKLKERINNRGMLNDIEEIEFFRNVKPQFTCYIEYFVILSEALRFAPEEKMDAVEFWKKEGERFQRFRNRNGDFIHYYESGANQMDIIYFKKVKKELRPLVKVVSYDNNLQYCSSHDHLIRTYLAYKKYHGYVQARLEALKVNIE